MKFLNIMSLCKREYIENRENAKACVATFPNVGANVYTKFCLALLCEGFEKKEEYDNHTHSFCAFSKDNLGVFVNYYHATREMRVVEEEDCAYFSFLNSANSSQKSVPVDPQITQVKLEDYGMSYVIRLSNGRFIVIDGGREFEPDSDRLFEVLKSGAKTEKPIIAAWIMTHPHSDHFHCLMPFIDSYGDQVVIEKFMLNFPEYDDVENYPKLLLKNSRFEDSSPYTNIPKMYERMERMGAPIYMVHTGQKYLIGDAKCEILASIDDTIHVSKSNINYLSLVIRMELGGQVILWASDASFEHSKLVERYGSYLKSDILQVPHHGFGCGSASEQIKGFEFIKPSVCLLPVSDYNAYTMFCTYIEGTSYLMQMPCVKEMITGETQRTITLPYSAPPIAKVELDRKFTEGRADGGSRTWVYSDLSTACTEDFEFTVLNMTNKKASLSIDIFFETSDKAIRYIKATVDQNTIKHLSIVGDDVDGDALYFNWMSLKEKGIPENAPFAVRFMSNVPIVVSHKKHKAAYYSSKI